MGKGQRTCPFNYWRVRERQSPETKGHVWAKIKGTCAIGVLSVPSKSADKRTYVWGKGKRYWIASEENSDCTGKFHQSPETKKGSVEAQALLRLGLKNGHTT